ncbi:MAG: Holliday junction branch migration protein RuvA [Lachnospiraceae bacterium]|nr:Holliday junction branch migration protein RuvA [Lachnospiraceae bacterium]
MFAYIKGTVEYIASDYIVIDNGGVGFKINTSVNTAAKLSLHETALIHTHLSVREDDMSLFGFYTEDELSVFKLLISISGIGPKGALAILSTLSIDELRIAVLSDDHKAIAKANGVGAKTAQRVVIELKDKFKLEDVLSDSSSKDDLQDVVSNDIITETAMALTSLGYSNVEALRAIKKVPSSDTMSVEELLKAALKYIM